MIIHRLTATDTPMVRYTRTIFPSYAEWVIIHFVCKRQIEPILKDPI